MFKDQKRKANILAVDDYEANITALEAVLSSDYNVIVAHSGPEALSILEKNKDIHVILMDVQMPEMDGFETSKRIKQLPHCESIPIIFITAIYKEDPFVKKGYEFGGVDYFSKPYDPEILKMKIGVYASYMQKHEVFKNREKQIKETEDLLRVGRKLSSALESLPVGVLIADVAGRICQTNKLVADIYTSSESKETEFYGEALGWWDSDGQMIKDKDGPLYRAIFDGESSHNQILRIKNSDGMEKVILGSASPLLAMDKHIVGAVVILKDVTESKKIKSDLENQIIKLVEAGVDLESRLEMRS